MAKMMGERKRETGREEEGGRERRRETWEREEKGKEKKK